MIKDNKKDESFEIRDILGNVTIIYNDGKRVIFDAIRVIDKGVTIGRIIDGDFLDCGFISKKNIKEIRNGKQGNDV
jgi:hypothetical protein